MVTVCHYLFPHLHHKSPKGSGARSGQKAARTEAAYDGRVRPLDERVAALEQLFQQGREEHQDIARTLEKLTAQVSKLEVYLANGNGGLTLSVRDKRLKFAWSLPLPWSLTLIGGGGSGVGWLLGRVFGAW